MVVEVAAGRCAGLREVTGETPAMTIVAACPVYTPPRLPAALVAGRRSPDSSRPKNHERRGRWCGSHVSVRELPRRRCCWWYSNQYGPMPSSTGPTVCCFVPRPPWSAAPPSRAPGRDGIGRWRPGGGRGGCRAAKTAKRRRRVRHTFSSEGQMCVARHEVSVVGAER